MTLNEIATIINGQLVGNDASVLNITIDSRALAPGDLYLALVGEHHDGHDFIDAAFKAGACAVISDRTISQTPYIKVTDTLAALQQLGAALRANSTAKVIAVTGSCGKTTTRAFLQSVFSEAGNTHASIGSFNNNIGVPLTLLGLTPSHDYLISEIGTNHLGEIEPLAALAKPDVAIITNVSATHLEGLGTVDNIATEKAAIFSGLSTDGVAIINADDHFASYWQNLNSHRKVVTFGIKQGANVMAEKITLDSNGFASFTLVLPGSCATIKLAMIGKHNVLNALAAASAAYAQGLSIDQIKRGLEATKTEKHRL